MTRSKATKRGTDEYVALEDEELDSVALESTRTIDIDMFVPRDFIGWIWYDRPHYLVPDDPVGEEAFSVIRDAMATTHTVGISRLVLYRRERAVMLVPRDRGIVLWTLRYGDEVREPEAYFGDLKAGTINPRLKGLVTKLIDERTKAWDPQMVTDPVQGQLLQIIAAKKKGKRVRKPKSVPEPASNVVNIMDALILQADLAPLALAAANWGARELSALRLLDPPPAGAWAQARDLLAALEAIAADGTITGHGRKMAALPLHPRLAHMVIRGTEHGSGRMAADIAALLGERDPVRGLKDAGIAQRLDALHGPATPGVAVDPGAARRIKAAARQIGEIAGITNRERGGDMGALLALAYPDRVAKGRDRRGHFRLAGGGGAVVDEADPLAGEPYLAVATTDGNPTNARIFLAAPLAETTLRELFASHIVTVPSVHWDRRKEAVVADEQERLGALVLAERRLENPDPQLAADALLDGVRILGLDALPWSKAARSLRHRVLTLRRTFPEHEWPDWSDEALRDTLPIWLKPHILGLMRRRQLDAIDLSHILSCLLSAQQKRQLDRLLPAAMTVPSGSVVAIEYDAEGEPVLRVKLQEMFGLQSAPRLAEGRVPLKVELLSPAGRPLAVTRDLAHFWATSYRQVRAEMRGRYPKHPWPENPLTAAATPRPKPR